MGVRESVLEYLYAEGGEVLDSSGRATGKIAEAVGAGRNATNVLGQLDSEGLVEREVRGKRTYSIKLTEAGVALVEDADAPVAGGEDPPAEPPAPEAEPESPPAQPEPASEPDSVADRVLAIIEEAGGEIVGQNASRYIKDRMPDNDPFQVSSVLGQLDQRGAIVRDMPNTRTVIRIAINDGRFAPARKSVDVIVQDHMKRLAKDLQENLDRPLPEISGPDTDEIDRVRGLVESLQNELHESETQLDLSRAQVQSLKSELQTARNRAETLAAQVAELDQVRADLAEARTIIQRQNDNIARMNRGKKPTVQEAMATIEEHLGPERAKELREMQQLMQPGPSR